MSLEVVERPDNNTIRYSTNEVFGPTIQGEGLLAGALTHFIRFNGCDYQHCSWCDTLDAVIPERFVNYTQKLSAEEICDRLTDLGGPHRAKVVTLSGGNPAIHKGMFPLILRLRTCGYEICLETQGSISQKWFEDLDWMVLSPKPPSSGMPFNPSALKDCWYAFYRYAEEGRQMQVCFKVVIFDDADLEFAAKINQDFVLDEPISKQSPFFLQVGTPQLGAAGPGAMPKGAQHQPTPEELCELYRQLSLKVLADGRFPNARVLPQLHKLIFGHGRGV
jgi:7-carboxy-7-deazaguanine synthase